MRGSNKEFHITEKLCCLVALKGKITGADGHRAIELVMNDIGLKYDQLCGWRWSDG